MNDRLLQTLAAADPARDVPVAPGDVEQLLRRADEDGTGYELRPADRRRRTLVALAAAAAVTAVTGATVAVILNRSTAGPAVPPPVPSVLPPSVQGSCLARVAAGIQPAPYDGATGRYEYLRTSGTHGGVVQTPDGTLAIVSYPMDQSTWTAADGWQRRRMIAGPPQYLDEASQAYYRDHPALLPRAGAVISDLPPGESGFLDVPAADPEAMAAALYEPGQRGPSQAIAGAVDLTRARVLDAEHRAALLRFLAGTDGVDCGGEASDPTGRKGVVVTVRPGAATQPTPGDPGGPGTEVALVDPGTGEILAGGRFDANGITWREVFLERGLTDSRPAAGP